MKLNDINVLIDGYNLELKHGTGVKTYASTLIETLKMLGANVSVLCSKRMKRMKRKDPVLDQILFFDEERKEFNKFFLFKEMLKALSGFYKAKEISFHKTVVIKETDNPLSLKVKEVFNLPACYTITHSLFKKFHIITTISIPKKINVWHSTYPLPIKIKNAKKIATIHDLVPLRLPYATLDDKISYYKTSLHTSKSNKGGFQDLIGAIK